MKHDSGEQALWIHLQSLCQQNNLSLAKLAEIAQEGVPVAEPTDELKAVERSARVALISWAQAGSFADASDYPQPRDDADWMPRPKYSGAKTLALRVRGESMEPAYQHGDIIFVDPDVTPVHGKDVIIPLGDRNEVVFNDI